MADLKAASSYLQNAEKIASLVHEGALQLQKKKWYQMQQVSKYQLLWIRSIRRVIRMEAKTKIVTLLKEKGYM
jgi:hypothetical protein